MAISPLATMYIPSPNTYGKRTGKILKITPHHMAVVNGSIKAVGNNFAQKSRKASSNYGIDSNGNIACYLDEDYAPMTSSNKANDMVAVTIEVANSKGAPNWEISDKAWNALVDLCVDICKRNGISRLDWTGDKNGTLTIHRMFNATACVPLDTEVLTKTGWVEIKDINIGDKIACAHIDDLAISFEEVFDKVPVKQQDTYTNNGLTVTKDHRLVYRIENGKNWKLDEYQRLYKDSRQIYIPMAGNNIFEGINISNDMIKFIVSVQADAHYMYEEDINKNKKYYGIEYHLKKERKINRLEDILNSLFIPYKKSFRKDGTTVIRIYNYDNINIVNDICEQYLDNKTFTWDLIHMNKEQANVFLDEILLWDGCEVADKYCSTIEQNLDVVSAIATINNKGSYKKDKELFFRNNPIMTLSDVEKRNIKDYVTCVRVNTGLFLARQNGRVFVIGNCPGNFLAGRMGLLQNEINSRLGNNTAPNPVTQPATPSSPVVQNTTVKYTVKSGDTISGIAKKYGVTEDAIVKANNIKDKNKIYVGQVLTIPTKTTQTNVTVTQEKKEVSKPKTYTVKKNQTLSGIGKELGMNWKDIAKINNIKAPYIIHTGQVLKLE